MHQLPGWQVQGIKWLEWCDHAGKFCPADSLLIVLMLPVKDALGGKYQNENDKVGVVCTVCRAGTFASTSETTVCTNCPAGKNLVVVATDAEEEDCQLCKAQPGLGIACLCVVQRTAMGDPGKYNGRQ